MSNLPPMSKQQQLQQQQQALDMADETGNNRVIRCDVCNTITHKVERTIFGKKKIPLTVQGKSLKGICLICNFPDQTAAGQQQQQPPHGMAHATAVHNNDMIQNAMVMPAPLPPHNSLHHQQQQQQYQHQQMMHQQQQQHLSVPTNAGVPPELFMERHDDATVVSAITLDHRFDAPDESDDDEESGNFRVTPGTRRPEPSLGDPDEYQPQPLRRKSRSSDRPNPHHHPSSQQYQNAYNNNPNNNQYGNYNNSQQQQELQQPQFPNYNHPNNHPQFQQRGASGGAGPGRPGGFYQPSTTVQPAPDQYYSMGGPPPLSSPGAPWRSGVFDIQEHGTPFMGASPQEEKTEIEPAMFEPSNANNNVDMYGVTSWQKPSIADYDAKQGVGDATKGMPLYGMGRGAATSSAHSLIDIPVLINLLNSSSDGGDHVKAIQSLADIIWGYGQQAKVLITDHKGLEGLTQSMWTSMADASVQEAALNLIFALASSSDGLAASDVLTGNSAQDAIDALLIVMQTHLTVENIQHTGCGILACLSAATSNNSSVDDASLSGALVSVVSAMEAHRNSTEIQEWGIRALYNQCVYSRHAESNKRSLALSKSGMEENKCGAAVIYRAIEITEEDDMVTVEWACRLYWCLSASEDVAEMLTVTHHPIQVILEALQRYHQVAEAASVLEAIFGALANLVKVKENHKLVDPSVLFLVVRAAQSQHTNEDLLIEACALIANLVSLSSDNAVVAVNADAIDVIFNGLQAFPENVSMFEEAMRCLTCLSVASEDAKGYLCTRVVLSFLANMHSDSAFGQEMFVNLMGSIMTRDGPQHTIIAHGGVDMLLSAMRAHPNDRRVQEAGCLAVRNLACHGDEDMRIDFRETINCITQAMAKHEGSESIQLNGCCTLWNVASKGHLGDSGGYELSDKEMMECIVKAMQTHMESASVLEMACGALCSKINGSPQQKEFLVESGGLDAVTCVLVMHPNEPAALEKAFGVLSCMSASTDFADDVANAQCMINVMEAMRANSSSISLLEFGCLVLRNIILLRSEHASEASSIVATILNAMGEHPGNVEFQREACSLLWAMAAVSETCKSKVLSLDGIAVLLNCLEHNSSFTDVQDAALGAFNQLSSGTSA